MRKVFINIKQLLQIRAKGEFKVAGVLMNELPKIDKALLLKLLALVTLFLIWPFT